MLPLLLEQIDNTLSSQKHNTAQKINNLLQTLYFGFTKKNFQFCASLAEKLEESWIQSLTAQLELELQLGAKENKVNVKNLLRAIFQVFFYSSFDENMKEKDGEEIEQSFAVIQSAADLQGCTAGSIGALLKLIEKMHNRGSWFSDIIEKASIALQPSCRAGNIAHIPAFLTELFGIESLDQAASFPPADMSLSQIYQILHLLTVQSGNLIAALTAEKILDAIRKALRGDIKGISSQYAFDDKEEKSPEDIFMRLLLSSEHPSVQELASTNFGESLGDKKMLEDVVRNKLSARLETNHSLNRKEGRQTIALILKTLSYVAKNMPIPCWLRSELARDFKIKPCTIYRQESMEKAILVALENKIQELSQELKIPLNRINLRKIQFHKIPTPSQDIAKDLQDLITAGAELQYIEPALAKMPNLDSREEALCLSLQGLLFHPEFSKIVKSLFEKNILLYDDIFFKSLLLGINHKITDILPIFEQFVYDLAKPGVEARTRYLTICNIYNLHQTLVESGATGSTIDGIMENLLAWSSVSEDPRQTLFKSSLLECANKAFFMSIISKILTVRSFYNLNKKEAGPSNSQTITEELILSDVNFRSILVNFLTTRTNPKESDVLEFIYRLSGFLAVAAKTNLATNPPDADEKYQKLMTFCADNGHQLAASHMMSLYLEKNSTENLFLAQKYALMLERMGKVLLPNLCLAFIKKADSDRPYLTPAEALGCLSHAVLYLQAIIENPNRESEAKEYERYYELFDIEHLFNTLAAKKQEAETLSFRTAALIRSCNFNQAIQDANLNALVHIVYQNLENPKAPWIRDCIKTLVANNEKLVAPFCKASIYSRLINENLERITGLKGEEALNYIIDSRIADSIKRTEKLLENSLETHARYYRNGVNLGIFHNLKAVDLKTKKP